MSVSVSQIAAEFNKQAFGKPVLFGQFFHYATKNATLTKERGYPVYETQVFVRIKTQGRRDTTARVATDDDKRMFKEAWEKFEQETAAGAFTPLNVLPGYTVETEHTLKDLGVTNAEELAEYDGELYTYEMHVMRDAAQALGSFWLRYTPPEKQDVRIPESNNRHGPEHRQEIREGSGFGEAGGDSPAPRQFGVFLDEEGNVSGVGGIVPEARQEEGPQKGYEEEVFVAPDPDELIGSFVA